MICHAQFYLQWNYLSTEARTRYSEAGEAYDRRNGRGDIQRTTGQEKAEAVFHFGIRDEKKYKDENQKMIFLYGSDPVLP